MNDPYKLKWKVSVEHLKLLNAETPKTDNKLHKLWSNLQLAVEQS